MSRTIFCFLRLLFLPLLLSSFSFSAIAQSNAFSSNNLATSQDDFLAVEQAYQLQIEFEQNPKLSQNQAVLIWLAAPEYYLYKHGFKQFHLKSSSGQDNSADNVLVEEEIIVPLPQGIETEDEYFGKVETYYHQVVIPLTGFIEADKSYLRLQSQGCADAGLCYPPYDIYAEIDWQTQSASFIDAEQYRSLQQSTAVSDSNASSTGNSAESFGFWAAIIGAFIGGLILNLMPCVLPVLSIKLLQLQKAHSNHKVLGLAYMAGVILSFCAIALVLIALRESGLAIGWGFQLQQPWFVAALVFLFFSLALSLSGYFELGSRLMGLGQNSNRDAEPESKHQISSAFSTGVLAVVVASPCTAPFMGTALGYALTQSNLIALSVFFALGLGMALPLAAMTFIPQLEKLMPKPGLWMVKLKEFFAFPLYLTVIWLLWVLLNQTSSNTLALMLVALTGIVFAIWCFKFDALLAKLSGVVATAAVVAFLFSPSLASQQAEANSPSKAGQLAYSAERLSALRAENQAVFIDLTADWCITCLANKKRTLDNDHIQEAFREAGIAYMVGDWTNYDPAITKLLQAYGRSGIPLYLLFPADGKADAMILPQLLNDEIVMDAINSLK